MENQNNNKNIKRNKPLKKRLKQLHKYYKRSGLYKFVLKKSFSLIRVIILLVGALLLINYFVIDIQTIKLAIQRMNTEFVLVFFLISESLFGMIPPDIFIAWSEQFKQPYLVLTGLAAISYIGGINSYFIGKGLRKIPGINRKFGHRFEKNMALIKKWGGVIIIIAALLPLPYSTICMAGGMIRYPLVNTLLYGLTRFIRFFLYAFFIFNAIA